VYRIICEGEVVRLDDRIAPEVGRLIVSREPR
jgi:hypothetical protein